MRLAVIGDPIVHSRSPSIQTAAMRALGIQGTYLSMRVSSDDLAAVIGKVRTGELDGLNVTMPYKRIVAGMVDDLSDDARRAASVNTVVRAADGRLQGHSTDISALRRLWRQNSVPTDRATLVLGAGGAAAAACIAAPTPTLYVSARRPEAARTLAAGFDRSIVVLPWAAAVADGIVVNATSLGMDGEELPGVIAGVAAGLVDLAYGDDVTPAVSHARLDGLPTIDGLEILVAQAGDSLRLWTGEEPPWKEMAAAARNPSRQAGG